MSTRVRWLVLLAALGATALTQPARAQTAAVGQAASPTASGSRVLLMHDDAGTRGEFAQQVERLVQRSLRDLSLTVSPSPLPFRDAQLAAGCAGSVRECGAPVAAALESEELLVSRIEDPPGQQATLTLLRFAPRTPARSGTAQLPRAPAAELSATVRALVESMFSERAVSAAPLLAPSTNVSASSAREPAALGASAAQPAPVSARAPESDYVQRIARVEQRRRLLAIGWPTLTVGAGLVVGGVIANLAARRESRAYESLGEPNSRDQVDAKLAHYRAAEDKVQAARILWGVGGGLAAAGVFVLLWERFAPLPDRKLQKVQLSRRGSAYGLRFAAAPTASGFAVACTGQL